MFRRSICSDARAPFIDRFERWPYKPPRIAAASRLLVDTSMNQSFDRPIATPIYKICETASRKFSNERVDRSKRGDRIESRDTLRRGRETVAATVIAILRRWQFHIFNNSGTRSRLVASLKNTRAMRRVVAISQR